jgi:F-type H+/Na+-transporting ATPase subunit alpha
MEPRVKAQVDRGQRIRALITQPRFAPLRPIDEIALLAALANGVFDKEPVGCIATVRTRLAAHLDAHGGPAASAALVATGTLDEATLSGLVAAVRDLAVQVRAAPEAEARQETKPEATST